MNRKQWIILFAGIMGLTLVVLCPRWRYYHSTLTPDRNDAGYRFITQSPEPLPVIEHQSRRRIHFAGQSIQPRIDYADFSLRTGVIIAVVLFGLWSLRSTGFDGKWGEPESNIQKLVNRVRLARTRHGALD